MKRGRKGGYALLLAGAVLLLSAFLFSQHNRAEDEQIGQKSERLLTAVEAILEDTPKKTQSISGKGASALPDPEMPTVVLDGYEYVGYLEIPALELKLPVMSEWDDTRLKIAPCRQFGSSRTEDLVIAAHNYESHFGRLPELTCGDSVLFTDMDGRNSTYSVADIRTLRPSEVALVQDSGYGLVLYTCTYGGKSRVTVFCRRVEEG